MLQSPVGLCIVQECGAEAVSEKTRALDGPE